jgi:hypothetical protein
MREQLGHDFLEQRSAFLAGFGLDQLVDEAADLLVILMQIFQNSLWHS